MTLHISAPPTVAENHLGYAREIIRSEAAALELAANRLDDSFEEAVQLFARCTGRIAITGTGKSADVGQKLCGTLNSTGTRAYLLDSTRAVHGDLGMIDHTDVVLAMSHSGESEEITRLLPSLRQMASAVVALTGNAHSTLGRHADVTLAYGPIDEVCPLGLAPSTSTTVMIAIGDALAFVLTRIRQFTQEDFARYHPAGSLGRKLLCVEAVMRKGDNIRVANCSQTVRDVFATAGHFGRRTGAVILTDNSGKLRGLFTDSDLARLFEQRRDDALDRPIAEVMTADPITVPAGTRVLEALELIRLRKISELPVVDSDGRPLGVLDITDVIALIPEEDAEPASKVA